MKDTILTARRKKVEIGSLLVCFFIANILHVYAIIKYGASFMELFTSFFYVLAFTIALYFAWCVLRICVDLLCRLMRKSKKRSLKY